MAVIAPQSPSTILPRVAVRAGREVTRLATARIVRVIVRRVLLAIPVIIGVTFITFCLLNLLPGDAAQSLLGLNATPSAVHALEIKLHLNEPFFTRYWHWISQAAQGNFGDSLASGQSVSSIIAQRLPVSLELIGLAFVMSIGCAVPVAVLAARKPRSIVDRLSLAVSMVGLSTPNFIFAFALILIFAVKLKVFPALNYTPISHGLGANLRTMVLPAASIAFGLFCSYTRILRGDIVERMVGEDYILAAQAKGLTPTRVLFRHALRNSLFGLLTLVAINLGTLIGSTVIIEQIFALPGIGSELFQAIDNRDIPIVFGIVTMLALIVVVANLITDLLYSVLDPRVRYGRRVS